MVIAGDIIMYYHTIGTNIGIRSYMLLSQYYPPKPIRSGSVNPMI
jgi:hypothetical protein